MTTAPTAKTSAAMARTAKLTRSSVRSEGRIFGRVMRRERRHERQRRRCSTDDRRAGRKRTNGPPDRIRWAAHFLPEGGLHPAYLQTGSPSPALVTSGFVVLTPIPHEKFASWLCVFVASHAPEYVAIVGIETPVDGLNFMPFVVSVAYAAESEKNDSSAVTRLRRSDFIAAMYAFDLVLANFGIAIAARMPMITTTIRSSIRVKPRRVVRMGDLGVHVDAPRRGEELGGRFFQGEGRLRPLQLAATVPAATGLHGRDVHLSAG